MNSSQKIKVKPFLKWAGGKGQLLNQFQKLYPNEIKNGEIKNYYEPFIGGGAVFFDIIQQYEIKNATLLDINEELIICWQVIKKDVVRLMEYLEQFQNNYRKLSAEKQKEFYYETREAFNRNRLSFNYLKYNEGWIYRAAQSIFMNKTCFNGLFRFNQKGAFNVPHGRYKNPKILDETNLQNVSKVLADTTIKRADFSRVENEILDNSFVYFDPPYRPISKTSSFKSYSKNAFNDKEQKDLAALFGRLDKRNIKLMLSNSDPKNHQPDDNFFDDLYAGFHIHRVPATRAINSNALKRKAINEIIVTNYSVI